jgi:TRAP-type uncharacterized transport system substrate-binding protein
MEGLASLVAEVYPQIHIEVVAGGGVANHARVGAGEIPMGILNPPMTAAALAGRAPFTQAYPALRVAVTNLTLNHLHCCVEQALPLPSGAAWMQHTYPLRLPVDRVGTVDRLVFQRLLPFPPGFVAELEQLGWTAAVMPAGAYGADGQSGPTVAMATSLGFHVSVPDDVVHAITSVICDGADRVRQIHPAALHFAASRAHFGGHGPLHPGAARYFREKGMPAIDV